MKFKISTIILPNNKAITFHLKNKKRGITKTVTFSDTHPNFRLAINWLQDVQQTALYLEDRKVREESVDTLLHYYDIYQAITKWSGSDLVITRSGATYKGVSLDNELGQFLVKVFLADPTSETTFAAWATYLNLVSDPNVSYKVTNRLFLFLQKNDLTITAEGKVLAWKVVRPNYKDKHSNTFDNSVGQVVEIARNQVNDDDNAYCSYGLHVCSWAYLNGFAGRGDPVMQVEVDVKDIISIPLDYNGEKVRVCKYTVLNEAGRWGETVSADRLPTHLISTSFAATV